jgi:cardiolipin synthase
MPPPVHLGDGTIIQLFKDGQAWHAAFDALRAAKRRICLEFYIFASDDTGRAVANLLCEKARAGLEVFVIYDAFGSLGGDQSMFQAMRRAGVRLAVFHPLAPWNCKFGWRPINRDHRKLLVIDDHTAGLGGINLAREYSGSWAMAAALGLKTIKGPQSDLWRDNAVGIQGPAARFCLRAFVRNWRYLQRGGPMRRAQYFHAIGETIDPHHPNEFGLLASVPTINSPLQPLLLRLLREAREHIQLTMAYFAPADALIDELCAAADRGVHVQLMLPGRGDVRLLVIAARSFYAKMMSHGIDVYERQNVVLHAKTLVIDGHTTVIGSTNLDYRSIEYNCEVSAVIRNATFGMQMRNLFDFDIRYSKQIMPDRWRERRMWDRVGQWTVSRARYLL